MKAQLIMRISGSVVKQGNYRLQLRGTTEDVVFECVHMCDT